jgi:hypothetical protein
MRSSLRAKSTATQGGRQNTEDRQLNVAPRTGSTKETRSMPCVPTRSSRPNTRLPICVAMASVLVAALLGCGSGLDLDTDDPAEAAAVLKVSLPAGAEDVQSSSDSSVKGNCTDLSFLIPTDQWQPYVSAYYPGQLSEAFANILVCNSPRPLCPEKDRASRFQAHDRILVDKSPQDRTVLVITECRPGQTLIAWKSSRI